MRGCIVEGVDEGLPIAYGVLEEGIPVLTSDGETVGTVHHVVAWPEKDIFHGIVIAVPGRGRRFVEAADVASLHERGVDLRIDSAQAQGLPEPGGGAPVYDEDPSETKWEYWARKATLRSDWHRKP
jgi:sporulation protein YlmC with PRC-barrel domain